MKKVYIKTQNGNNPHAGSKARDDIDSLLEEMGYQPVIIGNYEPREDRPERLMEKLHRHMTAAVNAWRLLFLLPKNAVVVMQHPMTGFAYFQHSVKLIKKWKQIKLIGLIHDLDSLRQLHKKVKQDRQADLQLLGQCEKIVCHNQRMKDYLIQQGFSSERLISLELFDYLTSETLTAYKQDAGIVFAGNLNREKAGFLRALSTIEASPVFQLYGVNFSQAETSTNVVYHGAFSPEELNQAIEGEFGLIWDGPSIETCEGNYGEYLRYNNSHKASFYLSVGLPLIVWKESALASFVLENNIGIAVASLRDIPAAISTSESKQLEKYAIMMQKKVTSGYFLKKAIKQVEDELL